MSMLLLFTYFYCFFCRFLYSESMKILAKNKRAYFDYEIDQTWDAGLVLYGHEVKACKLDHCTITEAIVKLQYPQHSLMLINMDIPLYTKTQATLAPGYLPKRPRSLLLTHRELTKIYAFLKQGNGAVIIPLELFEAKNRRLKLKIGLGRLRRKVEKKQILKERDTDKMMRREIREY